MSDTTKPPAINRLDPAWAMFAAVSMTVGAGTIDEIVCHSADFADAMLRERDRRDREERA